MNGPFVILAFVVIGFAAVCVLRAIDVVRQTAEENKALEQWYAARAEARQIRQHDESSLMDDWNSILPVEGEGEVREFKPRDAA